jgi:hypothetical protein
MKELSDANRLNYVLDRWTGEGTSNDAKSYYRSYGQCFLDYFVEDASYVRIQNVQLGYSLNSRYTEKNRYYQVKIVCRSKQPVHFTKYKGFDPGRQWGSDWWRN